MTAGLYGNDGNSKLNLYTRWDPGQGLTSNGGGSRNNAQPNPNAWTSSSGDDGWFCFDQNPADYFKGYGITVSGKMLNWSTGNVTISVGESNFPNAAVTARIPTGGGQWSSGNVPTVGIKVNF